MEREEQATGGLTRYFIDLPFILEEGDTNQPRIAYGYDPANIEEGWSGYYLTITNQRTGKTIKQFGFNEDLEGGEMLIILEKNIPDTFPDMKEGEASILKEKLILLDEHKGLIASGLPI